MKLYREVKASDRLPNDTGLTHPFKSWAHGMAYGVYAFKRHEIAKYLKEHPEHKTIWIEPIEITEGEIDEMVFKFASGWGDEDENEIEETEFARVCFRAGLKAVLSKLKGL